MKFQRIIILLSSILLISCASKQPKSSGPEIILEQHMMNENPQDAAFWMTFAVGKIVCNKNHPIPSFGKFSCAFKMAALINADENNLNSEKKAEKNNNEVPPVKPKTKFISALNEISKAGFLNEYIFYSYWQSHWFLEPGLKVQEYKKWMESNLKNHTPSRIGASVANMNEAVTDESNFNEINLSEDIVKSVSSLLYLKKHKYDQASLGVSVRYQITSNVNGWVDFYIYPKNRSSEDLKKLNRLADQATAAKSGIMYYAQKEGANKMNVLEESSEPDINFLKGRYELERNGALYIDELYISGNEDYFLKARSTYLKGHRDYEDEDIKTIFKNLLENVEDAQ